MSAHESGGTELGGDMLYSTQKGIFAIFCARLKMRANLTRYFGCLRPIPLPLRSFLVRFRAS